jgi:membrane-associated phospholipid phosphatase
VCITTAPSLGSDDPTPWLGSNLRWFIPFCGLAAAFEQEDWEGVEQLTYSIVVGQTVTELLKLATDEQRPDGSAGGSSFPSGHTSAAFGGAAFIQDRYGLRYAWPAYLGAAYTGWSRVAAEKHYPHDVVAGALVGMLSSYIFTTPRDALPHLEMYYETKTLGVRINWNW